MQPQNVVLSYILECRNETCLQSTKAVMDCSRYFRREEVNEGPAGPFQGFSGAAYFSHIF
jgi:hypothetical protein